MLLFLKMAPDVAFSPELVKQVKASIRLNLSPRHVPELILETQDIPVSTVHPVAHPRAYPQHLAHLSPR